MLASQRYTWQCGLKKTEIKLQSFQFQGLFLPIESNIGGSVPSVMGDSSIGSTKNKRVPYVDPNNSFG